MTPKQARAVLAANATATKGSFLHALHEQSRFDAAALGRLCQAMGVIAALPPQARGAIARRHAYTVYAHVLQCVIHHLNPHDGWRIRSLPQRALQGHLDRLQWVVDPIVEGKRGYGPWPENS